MFTGLVEEVAKIRRIWRTQESARLQVEATTVMAGVALGDSIAVNGVCLTVTDFTERTFTADAIPETMRRSNLGNLTVGSAVNLERALAVGSRFGGHIVAGHVDGIGKLLTRTTEGIATVLAIGASAEVLRYIVDKGSVCVDGVSLTVMDVSDATFRISIIPHTWGSTTLAAAQVGTIFNLECDVLAKYVEKLLFGHNHKVGGVDGADVENITTSKVNMDFLRANGFA